MKRIPVFLLSVILLLTVFTTGVYSQQPRQSMDSGAPADSAVIELRPIGNKTAQTRKAPGDNMIYPSATLNNQSALRGLIMKQHYVLVNNGAAGQSYAIKIFKGSKVNASALANEWHGSFPNDGLYDAYELTVNWDTSKRELGQYTVWVYTVDAAGKTVGQSFYSTVYIVSEGKLLRSIALKDYDTGAQTAQCTLPPGAKKVLVLRADPSNHTYGRTIAFVNADPAVARVTEVGGAFTVEALKDGWTTVNINMGGKNTVLTLTVETPITALALKPQELTLNKGAEYWLTVTTAPEGLLNALTWSSSNPEAATVRNGLVKAVSPGTAVITVTKQGLSAQCTVTVPPQLPATELSLAETEATVHSGELVQLTPVLTPTASDSPITWDSSDKAVAAVSRTGLVTAAGAGTATITASTGDLQATFTLHVYACPAAAFKDMPPYDNWAHEGIDFAVSEGLFSGTGTDSFSPKRSMTRAMLAAVLYRMAKAEKPDSECPFADVPADSWYYDSVVWAYEAGIVAGDDKGNFLPEGNVTREQIVQMLMSYTRKFTAADTEGRADLSVFPDADSVAAWAKEAMSWAVAEGLMNGVTSSGEVILRPAGEATREQVASILMRYIRKMSVT